MSIVDRWLLPDGIEEVLPPEAKKLETVTYPGHFETRLVSTNGGIRWYGDRVPVGRLFAGFADEFDARPPARNLREARLQLLRPALPITGGIPAEARILRMADRPVVHSICKTSIRWSPK